MTETKHMTLYDLGRIYDDAYENRARLEFPTPEMKRAMHRAGIRAVVTALLDEFDKNGSVTWTLHQILASDGVKPEGSE
jgi:hypothetical protein